MQQLQIGVLVLISQEMNGLHGEITMYRQQVVMIEWNYKLERELHASLASAFNAKGMARLLRYELEGRSWGQLVSLNEGFDDQLFDLIQQAVREGWATELTLAAQRANPNNPKVASFVERLEAACEKAVVEENSAENNTPILPTLTYPEDEQRIPYVVTDPILQIEWCWIPCGPFKMGEGETPHAIDVQGYWMMRHPVTNAHYAAFIADGGYRTPRWWTQPGWQACYQQGWKGPHHWPQEALTSDQQPIIGVSWYEAYAFAKWLAATLNSAVKLPTEAQWEKAARGTDGRLYPWGDEEPSPKLCNYGGHVGKTTVSGNYSPIGDSPYGCADMAGNVWEWCRSQYGASPYDATDGRNDVSNSAERVLCGGSWNLFDLDVRSTVRHLKYPEGRYLNVGFRCVCEVVVDKG